jgi:hypothetical protein
MNAVFDLSPRLTLLPIVHGSADFGLEIVRRLQASHYDCLALPLPASFAAAVEEGVEQLPQISVAVQAEQSLEAGVNYVPIDPCQGVIAAIRQAMKDDVERAYIDLEVLEYESYGAVMPDAYALKTVALEKFAAALLPSLSAPQEDSQRHQRLSRMAYELHRLELEYQRVVCICSMADWPWLCQAYKDRASYVAHAQGVGMVELRRVADEYLYFVLGELPYITYLYEHRRAELVETTSLGIDGVKALLLEARDLWEHEAQLEQGWLTPQRLSVLLKYVRNMTLMDRRMTPDLYTLGLAAKQVVGDDFALALLEIARSYPPQRMPSPMPQVYLGMGRMIDDDGQPRVAKNRLAGVPLVWRTLPLKLQPPQPQRQQWGQRWNPYGQCSHLPEDRRVESFQQHVRDQAKALLGEEQVRVEQFTASLKDGLDMRETLRNWHTGHLYVRETPPARGSIEIVVFLFEQPADARRFNWCSTWYAEHEEESTLCFFATHFMGKMVGPGIAQAQYGGAFFLFPPRPIPDVWQDPRLDFTETLEERLLAGALLHSKEKRVALVAPKAPSLKLRQLAKRYRKQIVFLPLKRFSSSLVDRLRRFHVLNGKEVRSYAAKFIRDLR